MCEWEMHSHSYHQRPFPKVHILTRLVTFIRYGVRVEDFRRQTPPITSTVVPLLCHPYVMGRMCRSFPFSQYMVVIFKRSRKPGFLRETLNSRIDSVELWGSYRSSFSMTSPFLFPLLHFYLFPFFFLFSFFSFSFCIS